MNPSDHIMERTCNVLESEVVLSKRTDGYSSDANTKV